MNAVSFIVRPHLARRVTTLLTALMLSIVLPPATGLAQQTESLPASPAAVAAAISSATAAAVAAAPGQAAQILAASLAATSRSLGKNSPITLAVAKQTVSAVAEKLTSLNLQSEIASAVRSAVAVTPWLQAEITRAAIDAAPSLRSEILKASEQGAQEAGQQGQESNLSIAKQINTIIDQVNAQSLTANPTSLTEGSPTPTPLPTPTPGPSPTATPGPSPTTTPGPSPTATPGPSPTATPVSPRY
jgi:hypothetical protein